MRELKFRQWQKATKHYVYFSLSRGVSLKFNIEPDLEPYTGLKDKNGKEIYEGDIVEALIDGVWAIDNSLSFGKVKWKLEVIYNDIRFMDVFRVIGSKNAPDRIYYLFDKELSELEVIGNIHENPELLEAKNVC